MNGMRLTFCGVRGSYPVSDRRMIRYGGNSSSLLLESDEGAVLLDAGTGIVDAGRRLQATHPGQRRIHLFLTHLHIDHILGLPFFPLVYEPGIHLSIYCPTPAGVDLEKAVHSLFLPPFSPVSIEGIRAKIDFHPLASDRIETQTVCGMEFACRWHRYHPLQGSSIIKVTGGGSTLVYATDIELPNGLDEDLAVMIRDCDVLIHDSQYRDRDYFGNQGIYRGYGHSPVSAAVRMAADCDAGKLFLFHYDPEYTDQTLEAMLRQARKRFPATYLARESLKINI